MISRSFFRYDIELVKKKLEANGNVSMTIDAQQSVARIASAFPFQRSVPLVFTLVVTPENRPTH
jgi:hypothetical protein